MNQPLSAETAQWLLQGPQVDLRFSSSDGRVQNESLFSNSLPVRVLCYFSKIFEDTLDLNATKDQVFVFHERDITPYRTILRWMWDCCDQGNWVEPPLQTYCEYACTLAAAEVLQMPPLQHSIQHRLEQQIGEGLEQDQLDQLLALVPLTNHAVQLAARTLAQRYVAAEASGKRRQIGAAQNAISRQSLNFAFTVNKIIEEFRGQYTQNALLGTTALPAHGAEPIHVSRTRRNRVSDESGATMQAWWNGLPSPKNNDSSESETADAVFFDSQYPYQFPDSDLMIPPQQQHEEPHIPGPRPVPLPALPPQSPFLPFSAYTPPAPLTQHSLHHHNNTNHQNLTYHIPPSTTRASTQIASQSPYIRHPTPPTPTRAPRGSSYSITPANTLTTSSSSAAAENQQHLQSYIRTRKRPQPIHPSFAPHYIPIPAGEYHPMARLPSRVIRRNESAHTVIRAPAPVLTRPSTLSRRQTLRDGTQRLVQERRPGGGVVVAAGGNAGKAGGVGGVSGPGGSPGKAPGGGSGGEARSRPVPRRAYPRRRAPPGGWCCFAWNASASASAREGGGQGMGPGEGEGDGRCVVK